MIILPREGPMREIAYRITTDNYATALGSGILAKGPSPMTALDSTA